MLERLAQSTAFINVYINGHFERWQNAYKYLHFERRLITGFMECYTSTLQAHCNCNHCNFAYCNYPQLAVILIIANSKHEKTRG